MKNRPHNQHFPANVGIYWVLPKTSLPSVACVFDITYFLSSLVYEHLTWSLLHLASCNEEYC